MQSSFRTLYTAPVHGPSRRERSSSSPTCSLPNLSPHDDSQCNLSRSNVRRMEIVHGDHLSSSLSPKMKGKSSPSSDGGEKESSVSIPPLGQEGIIYINKRGYLDGRTLSTFSLGSSARKKR